MAASQAAQDVIYIRTLLAELGHPQPAPTPLHVDNQAAINLSYNPEYHERTRHIHRRHFFIREAVEDMQITVPFVASADNIADFFTKHLAPKVFFPMRDIIMNIPRANKAS